MSTSSAVNASSRLHADQPPIDSLAVVAGKDAIRAALQAVEGLVSRFDAVAAEALCLLLGASGRVIVTGLGKSGLVAAKLAGTFSSTGTPAQFIHATEALHGDVGNVCPGDVIVALSNSGETEEVCCLADLAAARGVPVVAMTGCGGSSTLAKRAATHLDVCVDREGDPHDLVPSASTTAMIVMGDALAIALMVARGFGPDDFHGCHPAGSLGRRLGQDGAARG
jgi:arabinose-5-phosphate isomerase